MGRISWHGKKKPKEPQSALTAHIGSQLFKIRQKRQIPMRFVADQAGLSVAFVRRTKRNSKTRKRTMTSQQKATIEKLTRSLGIGSRVDQGIKHVLGKMPINMSESRAASVIDSLTEEWNASEAKADADEARFQAANNYADCGRAY